MDIVGFTLTLGLAILVGAFMAALTVVVLILAVDVVLKYARSWKTTTSKPKTNQKQLKRLQQAVRAWKYNAPPTYKVTGD